MKTYKSFSSEETKKIAKDLVVKLKQEVEPKRKALVIALFGDLGAGKTTFTQGFIRGFGIKSRVNSPTFIILKRFKISGSEFKNLYHFDLYRIKNIKELEVLGVQEIFDNPRNIILIEWPEGAKKILPRKILKIIFKYGNRENERRIVIGV